MITRLFNNPHVLTQSCAEDMGLPEPAIAACTDACGLIVLSQEGRDLLVNPESVNELCRLLKKLRDAGSKS